MRPKNTHPLGPPKPVLPCQTSEVAKRRLTLAVSGPTASLGGRKFRAQTAEWGCLTLECRQQRLGPDPWRSMFQPKTSEFGNFGQTSASGVRPPN
mgnify:CR=1 FL=1